MNINYATQIENEGWNLPVINGATSGTVGKGLRLEAIKIFLSDLNGLDIAMEYQAHVQNVGWQPLQTEGGIAGTVGQGLRLEALRIRLTGADAKKYSVKYRVHVENYGWQLWKKDGDTAGTTTVALRAEAIEIVLELIKEDVVVVVPDGPDDPTQKLIDDISISIPPEKVLAASYATHVQNYGWGKDVTDGRLSGRVGQGLRMEAIRITIINKGDLSLGVAYATHVENVGWQPTVANGVTAGTTDQGLRLEAIKIWLTGTDADKYSIWYRTHVQNEAWQEWRRDGEISGSEGMALRAEAIQIIITLKSDSLVRVAGEAPLVSVNYRSHVQNIAWQAWVKNGAKSGTTGLGMRMEAFEIKLSSLDNLNLGVAYRAYVENVAWQPWVYDGATAGTTGQGLRIEGLEIKLTGTDADNYIIQYRGHIQNIGWTAWKKDGELLGAAGDGTYLRAEAISIIILKKENYETNITNEIKNQCPRVQIWASDFPRADMLLHDTRTDNKVLEPKYAGGRNKSSTLTFKMTPNHPYFDSLRQMYTTIIVRKLYSNKVVKDVFEGRVLTSVDNIQNIRTITCEGELGYFLDSVQRPAEYMNVTPEQWLTQVLDTHNMQVTSEKRFYMGICTVMGDTTAGKIGTSYRTHIQNEDWLTWVKNGDISGTTGDGLRMEAIEINLTDIGAVNIGVEYRTHVQNIGWQEWVQNGAKSGTTGQSLELQAIEIRLIGEDASKYWIRYRVHVENVGWQDWMQDGDTAGTVGENLRAEAISIIILAKDDTTSVLQDVLFRENDYVNTLECIKTTLLDTLGGVLVIEKIGSIRFLNYLENYGSVNTQSIEFGINMLDYSKTVDSSGIITALVPYGAEIDGRKLDISSANDGCDYIYDEVSVAEHGWITGYMEWPEIDNAIALKSVATKYLQKKIHEGFSFELTALDLNKVNIDIQSLEIGDIVPCKSKPHNIDGFLAISKKEEDLEDPTQDRIILGSVTQSLTDRISGPLGGGIMGLIMNTANSVQNMEYVSNEVSFLVKITADKVTETENRLDEASLLITAEAITATVRSSVDYQADLSSKASTSDLGYLTSRVNTAELKITSDAIVQTVTQSSIYINEVTGKVDKRSIINEINLSTEGIKISAEKITMIGTVTFEQAQSLANTAQTNATNAAATYASNARSGAVSDVKTGLGNANYTTINGGNITTGTINAARINLYGALNGYNSGTTQGFSIDSMGQLVIPGTGSIRVGTTYLWGNPDSVNTFKIYNGDGDIQFQPKNHTKIEGLYATTQPYNIPMTNTGSQKISNISWFSTYVNVTVPTGNKGITVWDSDIRLKTNIKPSTINAVNKISKADAMSFTWIADGTNVDCGFIAQQIEEAFGDSFVLKVPQQDGSLQYQINAYPFIPLLMKAIQELNFKMVRMKNEIRLLQIKGDQIC